MAKNTLTEVQKTEIGQKYQLKDSSQADLAIQYGVSRSLIRTTLHEQGLVVYNAHATKTDRSMLEAIQVLGITSVDKLREVLQRGLTC